MEGNKPTYKVTHAGELGRAFVSGNGFHASQPRVFSHSADPIQGCVATTEQRQAGKQRRIRMAHTWNSLSPTVCIRAVGVSVGRCRWVACRPEQIASFDQLTGGGGPLNQSRLRVWANEWARRRGPREKLTSRFRQRLRYLILGKVILYVQ